MLPTPLIQVEELSRLRITGPLTENTPVIVIQEVANAHGISFDSSFIQDRKYLRSLCRKINETPGVRVSFVLSPERPHQELEESEYPYLARYLNKNCSWTRSSLLEGWKFLRPWHYRSPPRLEDLPVGPQTPETPRSYNLCLLYRLCLEAGIRLHSGTTLQQMKQILELQRVPGPTLRLQALKLLQSFEGIPDSSLRNLLFHCSNFSSNSSEVGYLELEEEQGVLRNLTLLRKRLLPASRTQAIALGASIFRLDLTRSLDPMLTYLELREEREVTDSRFRELQRKNSQLVQLEYSFNSIFPASYYSPASLTRMARREGYTAEELSRSSPYQLLREAQLTNTFHLWRDLPFTERELESTPKIRTQTLFSLEKLDEIEKKERLYYGSRDSGFFLTTFSEIELRLRGTQSFEDPFHPGEPFSPRVLSKLLLLSQEMGYREVEIQIVQIRKTQRIGNEKIRTFAQEYFRVGNPEEVREALELLLRLTMVMRGWKGSGPYPISVCPPNPDELGTDLLLHKLMGELETRDQKLRRLSPHLSILNLPLLRYREGRYEMGNETQGFTIEDRLRIIRERKEVSSCIRMSSNWLGACVYKYSKTIGLPVPFAITDLAHIA